MCLYWCGVVACGSARAGGTARGFALDCVPRGSADVPLHRARLVLWLAFELCGGRGGGGEWPTQ